MPRCAFAASRAAPPISVAASSRCQDTSLPRLSYLTGPPDLIKQKDALPGEDGHGEQECADEDGNPINVGDATITQSRSHEDDQEPKNTKNALYVSG